MGLALAGFLGGAQEPEDEVDVVAALGQQGRPSRLVVSPVAPDVGVRVVPPANGFCVD